MSPTKHLWHCFKALISLDEIALLVDQITGPGAVDKGRQGQIKLCIFIPFFRLENNILGTQHNTTMLFNKLMYFLRSDHVVEYLGWVV